MNIELIMIYMSNLNKFIQLYNPFNGKMAIINLIAPIFAVISFFLPYEVYIKVDISARYLIGIIIIILAIIWLYLSYLNLNPSLICGSVGKMSYSKACVLMEHSKEFEYGNLVSFYHRNPLNTMIHFIGIGEITFIQEGPDDSSEIQIELIYVLKEHGNIALELSQNNKNTLEQTIIKPYVRNSELNSVLSEG